MRRFAPEDGGNGFRGVDWHAARTHVGIRAFTDLVNMRVDRYDRLRACHAVAVSSIAVTAGSAIVGLWQDPLTRSYFFGMNVASGTWVRASNGSVFLTGGTATGRLYLVNMNGRLYGNFGDGLRSGSISALRSGGAVDARAITRNETAYPVLEGEGYPPVIERPVFDGIVAHDGRLYGWGYGDASTAASTTARGALDDLEYQTGFLGADRPELLRWSVLGDPDTWPAENWIAMGARGRRIVTCLSALGRLLVLKEDGAFIFYRPDGIRPDQEPVQADNHVATDCVSEWAATEYDDGVYWMTSAGPLRWRGGLRAEPIGYGITGRWENAELEHTLVFPVPEYEAVAFCFRIAGVSQVYLWDTNRERWSGHFKTRVAWQAATTVRNPDDGRYRAALFRVPSGSNFVLTGQLSGRNSTYSCVAVTGAHMIPGRRAAIPRAIAMSGDFHEAGAGPMRATVPGHTPVEDVTFADDLPAGGAEGDTVYRQAGDTGLYDRTDGAWVPRAGVGRGYLELDFDYDATEPTRYLDARLECNWDPDFALDMLAIEYLD